MADYEIESPVLALRDGIEVNQIRDNQNIEFEVIPDDEEDEEVHGTSAESCFDFEAMKQHINLDVIDVNDDLDGGKDDGSPFDKYRRKMHSISADGKVLKYVVEQGNGPLVPENCVVYLRYQAYVEYQEMPFDSTLMQCGAKKDDSLPFNLARGQLLPGLHKGVLSMRKSEKAELLIHHDLAFGKLGCPPRIPPEAAVLFVVEVDRFVDCGDIHINEDDLDMEERKQFQHVNKKAKAHYVLASDDFKKENYSQAANKFRVVINMLHNARLASEEEEKERNTFLIKSYASSCICYHKMKMFKKVCVLAADAMRVSQSETLNHFRIMYCWGYAKMALNDFDAASRHLRRALQLQPRNADIREALTMLEKKKRDAKRDEKLMYQRAFGFQPASTVKITEVHDEQEEKMRISVKEQLMEFIDNPERDRLLLKERYTRKEEEIWVETAKGLGLYARAVSSKPRVIDIQKPAE